MWRALPSAVPDRGRPDAARQPLGRTGPRARPPDPGVLLFNGTIIAWHIPAAYNATLSSGGVHDLEHAMFFFTGLLFWARVIDPGPAAPAAALAGPDRLRGRGDGRSAG